MKRLVTYAYAALGNCPRQWFAAAFISLVVAARAHAQVGTAGDLQSWLEQPTMTGDWGGLRTDLLDHGVNVQSSYVGEVARNTNGLHGVATDYVQQFALGANVDLGRLGPDPGGTFRFLMTERTGRDLGPEKLGSLFQTNEVFGQGRNVRLSEISLEQSLVSGLLNVKLGLFPTAGTDDKEFDGCLPLAISSRTPIILWRRRPTAGGTIFRPATGARGFASLPATLSQFKPG